MSNHNYYVEIRELRYKIRQCEIEIGKLTDEIEELRHAKRKVSSTNDETTKCKNISIGKLSNTGVLQLINPKIAKNIHSKFDNVLESQIINHSLIGLLTTLEKIDEEIKQRESRIMALRIEIKSYETRIRELQTLAEEEARAEALNR